MEINKWLDQAEDHRWGLINHNKIFNAIVLSGTLNQFKRYVMLFMLCSLQLEFVAKHREEFVPFLASMSIYRVAHLSYLRPSLVHYYSQRGMQGFGYYLDRINEHLDRQIVEIKPFFSVSTFFTSVLRGYLDADDAY